jgi:hypothetical protein
MRTFRTLLGVTLAGACALAAVPGTAVAAPAPLQAAAAVDDVTGTYYPLSPARLMDTRTGLGAPKAKIGAQSKVDLQVAGRGGVPGSGVGSVVLNVTVTGPTSGGFLTVYPAGEARPNASSINFSAGWLGSNNVTVKLGAGGKVSIYNHLGTTDVVVDVVGFYAGDNTLVNRNGGQYQAWLPQRMSDTRDDGLGKPPAGTIIDYAFDLGTDNPHTRALVLNITAVAPDRGGFLTAWSGVGAMPTSSTVNYGAGKNVPNLAFVQTTPCTGTEQGGWCDPGTLKFRVYTSQAAHVVVDLVGSIDDATLPNGMRFKPLSPTRIADSRTGQGLSTALGPQGVGRIIAPSNLVTADTGVLALNVTAVSPTSGTVITVWPSGPKPGASNLNPAANQTVAGAVLAPIDVDYGFNVHNLLGTTHLLADVVGTFYFPAPAAATAGLSAKAAASRPSAVGSSSWSVTR